MVGNVVNGTHLRAQLRALGISEREFSKFIHFDRVDLRRTLGGNPASAEAVYRVLLGLELLQRSANRRAA